MTAPRARTRGRVAAPTSDAATVARRELEASPDRAPGPASDAGGRGASSSPPPRPPPARFDVATLPLHEDARVVQFRARPGGGGAGLAGHAVHAAARSGITSGAGPLPHRDRIQRAFGESHDLGAISAHIGGRAGAASARLGAEGYAIGEHIAFRTAPDLRLAAHEAAHVVQQRAGLHLVDGMGHTGDTHEQSADAIAERVLQGRSAADLLPAATPGTARVAVQLTPSQDANDLRDALLRRNGPQAIAILKRNADRESMHALRLAYGDAFGLHLRHFLNPAHAAQASGLAGDQIALAVRVDRQDPDAILGIIERITDAEAISLVISATAPVALAADIGPSPALSTLADLQAVLRRRLPADHYYRAMRLILEKAERELLREPAVVASDLAGLSASARDVGKSIAAQATRNAIAALRIDLAEERLRAADGKPGTKAEIDATLAIADLDASQRKALVQRLQERPMAASPVGKAPLYQADDATAIQRAIEDAGKRATATRQVPGAGLDVALENAGKLLRAARTRARDPKAPKSAKQEVERLERLFYRAPGGNAVLMAARAAAGNDIDAYAEKLELLGVDPVTIGAERLARISVTSDVPGLIATLKKIPGEHRQAALELAEKQFDVPREARELIHAYVEVGVPSVVPEPGGIVLPAPPDHVPPEVTIALADVLDGIARGPSAAHLVLARLQRLDAPVRKLLLAHPRYKAAIARLPRGEPRSQARDFAEALANAEVSPESAIKMYPGPAGPYQGVVLEHIRVVADSVGRATLRRGWVIHKQVENRPAARAQLNPTDAHALQEYEALQKLVPTLDDLQQAEVAHDLAFGSIQLTDSADEDVDPNTEAEFMYLRLHKTAGLAAGQPLSSWTGSPAAIEALTEFETMLASDRAGGVTRGTLAQLAEIYYRALRELEKHKARVAENESLAAIAATVAGVVVAVGISVLSAGAALPLLAASALSGVAASVASAAAGAAVRMQSTSGTVLRDLGAGFVEGVTSIAAAGLAARVVRGTSAGVGAGKAAASMGKRVVAQATGGHSRAAAVAEAALDGAFSGAAGELFQTAVDEATWDRGIGEAIARMLAAIARGGALGAAGGGLVGGLAQLARRAGRDTAENVGHLLDRASVDRRVVDRLSEPAQDELARATRLLDRGELAEAEKVIRGIAGLDPKHRELLLATARADAVLRSVPASGVDLPRESAFPQFVDDAAFRKLTGNQDAHAVVVIRDNKPPTIIAHKGTPVAAIREEVIHRVQWESSLTMRAHMQELSEEKLSGWHRLSPKDKRDLHIHQLEIEADAQRRIIRHLAGSEDDPEAALRILDAEEALLLANERLRRLRAATSPQDLAALDIDRVPRIFSATAQSAKPSGPGSRKAAALIGEKIDDAKVQKQLEDLGYRIHRIEGQGAIFRITRAPDRSNLPHLTIDGGTIAAGKPRASFAETKADAANEWARMQRDLPHLAHRLKRRELVGKAARTARNELAQSGYHTVRVELARMVKDGKIDTGTAGLIAVWGGVLEDLRARFRVDIRQLLAKHLTSKAITDAELSAFRSELREIAAREIAGLRGAKRAKVLQKVLEIQPDNASKGHLFRGYRREAMRAEAVGGTPAYGVSDGASPESFHGPDLANRRTPDDVVHIPSGLPGRLKPGRYAVEDKAGASAFKIEQAQDYARRSFNAGIRGGGFTQTKGSKRTVYDGLIYVFSRKTEAQAALDAMVENAIVNKVLRKEPGGIHIMYIDQFGKVVRL